MLQIVQANFCMSYLTLVFLSVFSTAKSHFFLIRVSYSRRYMIERIASHLADFIPRLHSNTRAIYQYIGIPLIVYPQLENELFCHNYYLRHLCDTVRFPDWPIRDPVRICSPSYTLLPVFLLFVFFLSRAIFLKSIKMNHLLDNIIITCNRCFVGKIYRFNRCLSILPLTLHFKSYICKILDLIENRHLIPDDYEYFWRTF